MKSNYIKIWGLAAALSLSSCLKDLDQDPSIDPDSKTENSVKSNLDEAEQALAKVYASLALTGQQGPSGSPDIQGIDEGTSQFTRLLFYMQELPTDEAVVAWSDPGVPDFHNMNWTASNGIIEGMYYRLAQTVSFANSFISINQNSQFEEMKTYGVAEARFIRAYAYYYLMDLFGATPIITEVKDNLTTSDRKLSKTTSRLLKLMNMVVWIKLLLGLCYLAYISMPKCIQVPLVGLIVWNTLQR